MSSLSYICDYGNNSNSEESDSETTIPCSKRPRLPAPNLSKVQVVSEDVHIDDNTLHGGRTRSFPHVRGNWATFVYVKVWEDDEIHKLVNELNSVVSLVDETCQKVEDLHVSVSRTVALKYHQIDSFSSSVHTELNDVLSFDLIFRSATVYCNDNKSRTFVALEVDPISYPSILNITKKIDNILLDYNLQKFYEDPSFHMSVLWTNGDKEKELKTVLKRLNNIIETKEEDLLWRISQIHCKVGNKQFQYNLKHDVIK